MNYDETLKILTKFQYYYPTQLKSLSEGDIRAMVRIWTEEFADIDKQVVLSAFELYVNSEDGKYYPSINAIKNQVWVIGNNLPTKEEAWNSVKEFMRNPSVEKYESFHPLVKKAIGGYGVVKSWSQLNTEIVDTSIAKQFKDSYSTKIIENKNYSLLPTNTRLKIENQKNMKLLENRQIAEGEK